MYAPVLPPLAPPMNDPTFRSASIPVTGAAVTARTLAVIFGELACDGGSLLSAGVARAIGEVQVEGEDAILGIPVSRTLGYERTPAWADDGRPAHCWGSPGGGGVVTFVDPATRVGYAYLNNASWSGPPGQDPPAQAGPDPGTVQPTRSNFSGIIPAKSCSDRISTTGSAPN